MELHFAMQIAASTTILRVGRQLVWPHPAPHAIAVYASSLLSPLATQTRYEADATPYLGRTFTGRIAPALPDALIRWPRLRARSAWVGRRCRLVAPTSVALTCRVEEPSTASQPDSRSKRTSSIARLL